MSIPRLLAIAAIFVFATLAWFTLGASIVARTGEFDARLGQQVAQLWGGEHRQVAPRVWVQRPRQVTEEVSDGERDGKAVTATRTRTVVDHGTGPAGAEPNRGRPEAGPSPERAALVQHVRRRLPRPVQGPQPRSGRANARGRVHVSVRDGHLRSVHVPREPAGGRPRQRPVEGARGPVLLPAGGEAVIDVAYDSRGLDRWSYAFARRACPRSPTSC